MIAAPRTSRCDMPSASPESSSRAPDRPANAGVHFPPPLIFAAGILLGWLTDCARAFPITHAGGTATTLRLSVAGLLAIGWLAVFLAAFSAFRRAHTTLIPNRPATAF